MLLSEGRVRVYCIGTKSQYKCNLTNNQHRIISNEGKKLDPIRILLAPNRMYCLQIL